MEKLLIIKKILLWCLSGIGLVGLFVLACNYWVLQYAKDKTYAELEDLPVNDVALVLGASPSIQGTNGSYKNLYFEYRLDAAAALFHAAKVKHFILSGDNGRQSYDEPTEMKAGLIKRGIPANAITLDYAGFRTLDSVVRCKKVFQQDKITIVSQAFHNYRAIFLAGKNGIEAIAYSAKAVPYRGSRQRMQFREYLARTKAILDLYLLRKSPKFLGEKITIQI